MQRAMQRRVRKRPACHVVTVSERVFHLPAPFELGERQAKCKSTFSGLTPCIKAKE